jgi:hypothetical protein
VLCVCFAQNRNNADRSKSPGHSYGSPVIYVTLVPMTSPHIGSKIMMFPSVVQGTEYRRTESELTLLKCYTEVVAFVSIIVR